MRARPQAGQDDPLCPRTGPGPTLPGPGPLPPSILTRKLLADFHADVAHNGLHGRDRSHATRRKIVKVVQLAWAWLYDNHESGAEIPPPRKLRMKREPAAMTVAPT